MAGQRVLLVEDSEFMSQQIAETLSHYDIAVEVVHTAQAARETLESDEIDCILVNHDLPDETGLEFAESVSAEIPIILLTATSLDSLAAEAIEAGITEFVHKDNLATGSMGILVNRIDVAIRATQ